MFSKPIALGVLIGLSIVSCFIPTNVLSMADTMKIWALCAVGYAILCQLGEES